MTMNENMNLDALQCHDLNDDYELVLVKAPHFVRDGTLFINAETEIHVGDYYDGDIEPTLVEWARDHGGCWEWFNPGCLVFCVD